MTSLLRYYTSIKFTLRFKIQQIWFNNLTMTWLDSVHAIVPSSVLMIKHVCTGGW